VNSGWYGKSRQPKSGVVIKLTPGAPQNSTTLAVDDRDSIDRTAPLTTLNQSEKQLDDLIIAGAKRLLARAANARALQPQWLAARVRASVEKYVMRSDPEATAGSIEKFVDGLHADDLCLVIACERGDQAAWSELVEGYGATVRSAARSASSNEAMADDLAQSIWAELHGLKTRQDGKPAGKLAYYSGAGSLGGWLRAVVGQLAIDQHRRESRLIQTEEDSDLDRLAHDVESEPQVSNAFHSSPSPEEVLAGDMAASDVEKALARALAELDDEDRLLMKLYYFDGLRLHQAGAVLGVHEATASRRLTRIHGTVRQQVEAILMKEHGWTRAEATRSLAEVATNLQAEVEPMLLSQNEPGLQSSPAGN